MVLLGVCAFGLPYMPGNPPFPMPTGTWLHSLLTSHLLLSWLGSVASLGLVLDSLRRPRSFALQVIECYGAENLHLEATTTTAFDTETSDRLLCLAGG